MSEYWTKYNQLLEFIENDDIVHQKSHEFVKNMFLSFMDFSFHFAGQDSLKNAFCYFKTEELLDKIQHWEERFKCQIINLKEKFI